MGRQPSRSLFAEILGCPSIRRAITRNVPELQRQLRLCHRAGQRRLLSQSRASGTDEFEWVSSNIEKASDQAKAQSLLQQGQQAVQADDKAKLREIVEKLWKLLPSDPELRRQGYDSGVR